MTILCCVRSPSKADASVTRVAFPQWPVPFILDTLISTSFYSTNASLDLRCAPSFLLSLLSYPWRVQGCDQKGNPVGSLRCEGECGAVFNSLPESEKISDGAPHAAKLCNDRFSEPRKGWHGQFFSVRPEIWQASLSQLGISIFNF